MYKTQNRQFTIQLLCHQWRFCLPHGVNKANGEEHEDGDDEEEDLAPLLSLALEDDGIETALFEERGAVFVMVVVMVMLLFRHKMEDVRRKREEG